MTTRITKDRLIKSKITRLKGKLNKEKAKNDSLLVELGLVKKMEKLIKDQMDNENINKIRRRIASA